VLYRRGRIWWFEFEVMGRRYRETTRTASQTLAAQIERKRHRDIETAISDIRPRTLPPLFAAAAKAYLTHKKPSWAPKTTIIETTNIGHLNPTFGRLLLTDITDRHISAYQQTRTSQKAAPKTINNEVATLRAILRRHRLWAQIAPDVKPLPVRTDIGIALTPVQEQHLLKACAASRSRSLLPAVTLAIQTGLRDEELRLLKWKQLDLLTKTVTVGKSKTEHGTGRVVPLNKTIMAALLAWAQQFPDRKPGHYVFPSERVGFSGDDEIPQVFDTDPTRAITSWKVAWTTARAVAGVSCRWHDFRHTCISRLLERGVPLSVVASLMGWSPATTTRMAKRYAHFSDSTHRQVMETLDRGSATPNQIQVDATSDIH
jgi:integrase